MARTVYYTATTLDGYLADEHDSLDWLFTHDQDPEGPGGYTSFIADVGALVMGATTYRWVTDSLAASGDPWPYDQPSWVLTHRTLPQPDFDVRFAAADDPAAIRRVHAELVEAADGQDVWVVGGGALAAAFAAEGLLDEIMLSIAPTTLGSGRPLFPHPFDLQLEDIQRNGAFAAARYTVIGPR